MPYDSMQHVSPINYHLLPAKQEPHQKAYLLMKSIEEFSGRKKKSHENGPVGEGKNETEIAMGAGRRTRQEKVK